MPSSKCYKRNYDQEWKTAKARGDGEDNAQRHRARYEMEKKGQIAKGQDVGHKVAHDNGGSDKRSNLKPEEASKNRGWRTGSGYKVGDKK